MARRGDHSREEIRTLALQAAAAIVAEQGLQGLSVRKITSAIGYTPGSLYLVFANLDDLILQVNVQTLADLYEHVAAAAPAGTRPEQALSDIARAYLNFARIHRPRWSAIFEHVPEIYTAPEWHQEQIKRLFSLVEAPLSELTAQDRTSAEVNRAARALWGGVHGICILALTGKLDVVGAESVEDILNLLVRTYLNGLSNGLNPSKAQTVSRSGGSVAAG